MFDDPFKLKAKTLMYWVSKRALGGETIFLGKLFRKVLNYRTVLRFVLEGKRLQGQWDRCFNDKIECLHMAL